MTEFYRLPHHDGSPQYATRHRLAEGWAYRVRVRVPRDHPRLSTAYVRAIIDGEPRYTAMARTTDPAGDQAEWWTGEFTIEAPVVRYRFLLNHADGSSTWLCSDGTDSVEPRDARDFRATTYADAPDWLASQVMYQVFPDRFARSERASERSIPGWAQPAGWADEVAATGPATSAQLYGGDLDGLLERLDHLERLGVTLVYLTPFFPARSNHRYDASTFNRVDPLLGGDEALIRLVEAAHTRGMRVIGDLTTNHTGAAHEWFTSALGDPAAEEGAFFYWLDDAHTDYVAWYGIRSLPKLNWNSNELRRRFIEGSDSVVAKWLKPPYNLDGWRIDVANMTGRLGGDDLNREVQRTLRRTVDDIGDDRVLFAESTNDTTSDFDGEGWHAPMSYSAFTRPLWQWLRSGGADPKYHFGIPFGREPRYTAADVVASHRRFAGSLPWSVQQAAMNAIDTHDTPRFAERAGDAEQLVAFGLAVTLPGTPVIFAGDEFGLRGVNGEHARTPLPWAEHPRLADAYGELARLRSTVEPLQRGGLRWLYADDDALLFVRESEGAAAVVFASRSAAEVRVPITALPELGQQTTLSPDVTSALEGDEVVFTSAGAAFSVWCGEVALDGSLERGRAVLVGTDA